MSDQATAVDPAVLAAQMAIIDKAVRSARSHSWCGQFESTMAHVFPDGPPDGSREFVDSDGFSCRGYDRDGYNRDGLDELGYNREGRDGAGFDRDGFNVEGWDRNGRDRDGYNVDGVDRTGFTREGVHAATGFHRNSDEFRARFRFDRYGYDRDGFDRHGYDREGLNRAQAEARGGVFRFDENRLDVNGHNARGY